jgi:transposase-like protein
MNLKSRVAKQVFSKVMDGLSGLTDWFLKIYPRANIQRFVVHKVRNTLHKVKKKHTDEIVTELKKICKAPSIEFAKQALNDLSSKWDKLYPRLARSWFEDKDDYLLFTNIQIVFKNQLILITELKEPIKKSEKDLKKRTFYPMKKQQKKLYLKIFDCNSKWSEWRLKGFLAARYELIHLFEENYQFIGSLTNVVKSK